MIPMARTPSDLRQRNWQRKLPVKKQLESPRGAMKVSPPRERISLNQDWQFRRIEDADESENVLLQPVRGAGWERVNLPHSVRLEPLNASAGRNFQGICWYYKNLELPNHWKGKTILLHFEGAMQVAEVWLNDKKLAENYCGYLPFVVDLTPSANFGAKENLLSVRLDNRDNPLVPPGKPQKELDFTYFGGLYRNVRLEAMDRLRLTDAMLEDKIAGGGVFVTFAEVSKESAKVCIRSDVRNDYSEPRNCRILQELADPDGRVVGTAVSNRKLPPGAETTFEQMIDVANPRLWHPNHPHLYTLRTTVFGNDQPADELTSRIGIRHIRFDRRDGLTLNGEPFFSIGANRHQDHPYVGYALPDNAHFRDVKKLREAGFTSFRSHYPQAPAFMDACDELGMLAIVSNPGWQFVGGEIFQKRAIQNTRKMIRRDRNRPSVILWEAALNESKNQPLIESLHRAVHEEYPGEQCYTAGDREGDSSAWDVEYLRNDGSKPGWIREWGDHVDNWSDQQSRSRVPRGWGETPLLIQAHSHASRLNEIFLSRSAPIDGKPRVGGACLWAGIDCQRGYHRQPFYGGVLDLFRLPKFNHHFFRSQVSPEIRVPGLDHGPMVFIANFATFLSPTSVTIFSNCDEVRLTLDGKEIGRNKPDAGWKIEHPPFTFEVECFAKEQSTMYMTGVAKVERPPVKLIAEGMIGGKVAATHRVCPPGVATRLMLEADLCGRDLTADGSDWIRIYAKICDARGTVCPYADDAIEFRVEGDGRIIGNQQIGANPARAEAGIATVLIQAGRAAGKISVHAAAFGLTPGRADILSVKPG